MILFQSEDDPIEHMRYASTCTCTCTCTYTPALISAQYMYTCNIREIVCVVICGMYCNVYGLSYGDRCTSSSSLWGIGYTYLLRNSTWVLRPVPAVVPGVLFRAHHGRADSVPHRDVVAMDSHWPHSAEQGGPYDGVSRVCHVTRYHTCTNYNSTLNFSSVCH